MNSVAVIGGGITGLCAAFALKQRGIPVTLYEASDRVGGVIASLRRDGFLAELGPNTILETSPKIGQLIRDAGLQARRLETDPSAEARYLVRHGRPIALPSSPLGFLTTSLFSFRAKLALLGEPFRPPRRDGEEESIGQFVSRRLGPEFLDHAIDALVAGIYAGDPNQLSLPHAFPKLKALEDQHGSLIRGQIFGARARKKSGEVAKDRAPKFSFDEGLQVLPDGLAAQLGDSLRLGQPVRELVQTGGGWQVVTADGSDPYRAVIYCGTAHQLATLGVRGQEPAAAQPTAPFSAIHYPPVASVVLGFRREDVAHSCQGFGLLLPKVAGFQILGTIFSSALFPNRAPPGHVLLTSYIGGTRYPELAGLPAAERIERTLVDLRQLLGIKGSPVFTHTAAWAKAIPQYNVGYGKFRALLSELEVQNPQLYFAGHYRDGVSLGDSIVSGLNSAERVAAAL